MKMKLDEVKYLTNFLWRDFIGAGPHVNLLVDVHAGQDEEDARPPGPACQQESQPEDHSSLVFLADRQTQLSQSGVDAEPNLNNLHHK